MTLIQKEISHFFFSMKANHSAQLNFQFLKKWRKFEKVHLLNPLSALLNFSHILCITLRHPNIFYELQREREKFEDIDRNLSEFFFSSTDLLETLVMCWVHKIFNFPKVSIGSDLQMSEKWNHWRSVTINFWGPMWEISTINFWWTLKTWSIFHKSRSSHPPLESSLMIFQCILKHWKTHSILNFFHFCQGHSYT